MRVKMVYTLRKVFLFFLFAICFLLPFEPRFLPTVEILAVLFFLLSHSPKTIFDNLKRNRTALPFFLFFALTALSYFYSDDQEEATRLIMVKLPFLVIPLLLWGSGLSRSAAQTCLVVFVTGCAVACFILLGWAGLDYLLHGDPIVFVYSHFSRFMHVSYFSLYLLVCFGWFFMLAMENLVLFPRMHYLLMILFAVCLTLISAKIMLLAFIGSSFLFAGYYIQQRKRILKSILLVIAMIGLPASLYLFSPNTKDRVNLMAHDINERNTYTPPQELGSTAIRIVIWRDALPDIRDHLPWGAGAGDVKNMLLENYKARNMEMAYERKLNMHNEYLQEIAALGIPGIGLFLLLLILPSVVCYPPHRFIGLFFSFSMLMVSLSESVFERQAGTIFFCLVGILFMILYRKDRLPLPNS